MPEHQALSPPDTHFDSASFSRRYQASGCDRVIGTHRRLHRRAKQRRAAAGAFAQAVAIFERLGALPWAERARNELDLVGPRRRAPDDLTATELRVAELAAAGITNREIARAAFMSEKTVEAHMSRIYRKLGIHSRAELGARIAGTP